MTKVKTSDLIGPALDWAVELAKGTHWSANGYFVFKYANSTSRDFQSRPEWCYSTDWSQGGPIIERENITTGPNTRPVLSEGKYRYRAHPLLPDGAVTYGPTPLIAAMRCYVASKLGEEIDIPEELL